MLYQMNLKFFLLRFNINIYGYYEMFESLCKCMCFKIYVLEVLLYISLTELTQLSSMLRLSSIVIDLILMNLKIINCGLKR